MTDARIELIRKRAHAPVPTSAWAHIDRVYLLAAYDQVVAELELMEQERDQAILEREEVSVPTPFPVTNEFRYKLS